MKAYFPDTNFFFECRKASDLSWHELDGAQPGQGPDIRLIVPSGVIMDIERHKTKGNSRTAKRARDASALLRKALDSVDHRTEVRAANPRITLELPPVVRVDFSQFPNLDPARPDHQIAAEYAVILKDEPNLAVLSDDTLLVLAVRSLGFNPVPIPMSWKLAPEKDERDDEIDKLHEELRGFRQTSPDVSMCIQNSDGDEIGAIEVEIEKFEPSEEDIDRAMAAIQANFPMAHDFQLTTPRSSLPPRLYTAALGNAWRPPSDEAIETYKTKTYPGWLDSVRAKLPTLAALLNGISHEIPFVVLISNNGFVNASDVRITITGYDGITLLDSIGSDEEKKREEKLSLPAPPRAPRGGYMDYVSAMRGFATAIPIPPILFPELMRPQTRDQNSFYYADRRPRRPVEELELICEALPHQVDPYILGFRAIIAQEEIRDQPRIRVRLRASNLRRPIEKFIPFSVDVTSGNFLQRIDEIQKKFYS